MSEKELSKYPIIDELIKECEMTQEAENIIWLKNTQAETAVLLAEMHLMCMAGLSHSIPLRKHSQVAANYYYSTVNNKVHVFAAEQALGDVGITDNDLSTLFAHKDIFGRSNYVSDET